MTHAVIYTSTPLSEAKTEQLSKYVDKQLCTGMPIVLGPGDGVLQFLDDGLDCNEYAADVDRDRDEDADMAMEELDLESDHDSRCLDCRLHDLEVAVDAIYQMLKS